MSRVLIPFAEGFEEIEFVAIVDILRRAGVDAVTAGLDSGVVHGRSGIDIRPEASLPAVIEEEWDMVVLPGGLPNAHLLRDDANVQSVVKRLRQQRRSVAAICAAPTALAAYGITDGMRVTSYPSCEQEMKELSPSSVYVDQDVVEDDFLITSRGPGTAIEFALRLVVRLCGAERAEELRREIVSKA